jgi:hypothetical protein
MAMNDAVRNPVPESVGWPELPGEAWLDTLETLHMWTQVVGKIRMVLSPWINHSWSVSLYLTPRGLTTGSIPHGARTFRIDFDFVDHLLHIQASDGGTWSMPLGPMTVARFYGEVLSALDTLDLGVSIHPLPNEIPDPVPFPEDEVHDAYDADHARRLWAALLQSARVMTDFRARFIGKASPVHFFWGSFDLAVTRFSGRRAPEHPGGIPNLPDAITREAYSHELSSCGFWPGNRDSPDPIFYAYAYPTPGGFSESAIAPDSAFWLEELGEFILPYEAVRSSVSPDDDLLAFFQSTYEASANLASWDREALEWEAGYRPLGP